MRKRKPESSDVDEGSAAREQSSGPSRAGRLTPLDIQQIEFRRSFKGYDEREVDEFLDRLTEDFAAALDEAQRLRDRAEGGLGAVVTGGAQTGSKRTADEIVQRARDDAARIVREAQERATAIGAAALGPGAPVGGAGDRATIAPFIAKEREFLTSLAALVQGHAEAIRGMASSAQKAGAQAPAAREEGRRPAASRPGTGTEPGPGVERETAKQAGQRAPEPRKASTATPTTSTSTSTPKTSPTTPPTATPATPPPTQPPPAAMPTTPSTKRPSTTSEEARPAKPSEGSSAGGSAAPTPPGEGHVTIPEPDPAGAKRGDHKLAEGDPSLRELFWGEE